MTDRPILFSAPMVRALLDGRKTQTRRILKPQPWQWQALVIDILPPSRDEDGNWGQVETVWSGPLVPGMCEPDHEEWHPIKHHRVGDRLWVREAWKAHSTFEGVPPRDIPPSRIFYLADDGYSPSGSRGRPGIHMPRWVSRLTLTVTDVRVQRLQDISEEDARAEGCPVTWDGKPYDPPPPEVDSWQGYGRYSYSLLWSQINGPGSWAANPWIVAYTFTVHRGNIDEPQP